MLSLALHAANAACCNSEALAHHVLCRDCEALCLEHRHTNELACRHARILVELRAQRSIAPGVHAGKGMGGVVRANA